MTEFKTDRKKENQNIKKMILSVYISKMQVISQVENDFFDSADNFAGIYSIGMDSIPTELRKRLTAGGQNLELFCVEGASQYHLNCSGNKKLKMYEEALEKLCESGGGIRFNSPDGSFDFGKRNCCTFFSGPKKMPMLIKICETFLKYSELDYTIKKKINSISEKLNNQVKFAKPELVKYMFRFECSKKYFLENEGKIEKVLSELVKDQQNLKIMMKHYRLSCDLENIMFIFFVV